MKAQYFLKSTTFPEPQPGSSGNVIHQITHPWTTGEVINRQAVLQSDGSIRKSVRIPLSDLQAEKDAPELVRANISIPVPRVYDYYKSPGFEHLVMKRLSGITLQEAWQTLEVHERERIADEVVAYLDEIRKLSSPQVIAALLNRKPLRSGLVDAADLTRERFKEFPINEHIDTYIQTRLDSMPLQPNVFTHGDLDWSNILVNDKKVSGIIDWGNSGYFPACWEWLIVHRFAGYYKICDSWFYYLSSRLGSSRRTQWEGMWQLEELHEALGNYVHWGLAPENREENRTRGWAEVKEILGIDCAAPPFDYPDPSFHPWWLEKCGEHQKAESQVTSIELT